MAETPHEKKSVKGDVYAESLALHAKLKGKVEIASKLKLEQGAHGKELLSLVYTPGVAEACRAIAADGEKAYEYTMKGNTIAVVSDGTAVLGLGNIGAKGAIPVMEGKAMLFKQLGGVNAIPICLSDSNPAAVIAAVKQIAPIFGGINLEDIAAPACFEIEDTLKRELDIPVMHDDQHATAIVALAALINALKIVKKKPADLRVVFVGAGAAGTATAKLFLDYGVKHIVACDRQGAIYEGRAGLNAEKEKFAKLTNKEKRTGTVSELLKGADVLIGLSGPNTVSKEMVSTMAKDSIVFVMANPVPEIMPDDAKAAGARVVGTGRSDFPNQINNVLAFPGIFKGALSVRAREINEPMKMAAALAIANLVTDAELNENFVIPNALDPKVHEAVSKAVAQKARETKVARV